jgi:hypothetical protein
MIGGAIVLSGITTLTAGDKNNVKDVIVAKVGSVCGANGATACKRGDVTLSVARRADATVTYSVEVYTATAASTGSKAIKAVSATDMKTALVAKGGTLGNVSEVAVTASAGVIVAAAAPVARAPYWLLSAAVALAVALLM